MGSVKDLTVKQKPTKEKMGAGIFTFSDRYSVFDWGEMPDLIPSKGQVLATTGAFNFELLEEKGIKTHYKGLLFNGKPVNTDAITDPTNEMFIHLAYKPKVKNQDGRYQYEDLTKRKNFLIPLEIVFRNSIPIGSSLRKRYQPEDLGLKDTSWPDEEITLSQPMVEFSTKLEEQDRYLSQEEAYRISGLSEAKFEELRKIANQVNRELTYHASKRNFKHLDGKIECIFDRGEIAVADVTGTFDENRFSFEDTQISKEVLRQWYKNNDSNWYQEVISAKEQTKIEQVSDWTGLVSSKPRPIESQVKELVAKMYQAGANQWLNRDLFDAPKLSQVLEDLKQWKTEKNLQ